MDKLIQIVARRAGITSAAATLAVEATLDYLTARLPSLAVGDIREQLQLDQGGKLAGADGGSAHEREIASR